MLHGLVEEMISYRLCQTKHELSDVEGIDTMQGTRAWCLDERVDDVHETLLDTETILCESTGECREEDRETLTESMIVGGDGVKKEHDKTNEDTRFRLYACRKQQLCNSLSRYGPKLTICTR